MRLSSLGKIAQRSYSSPSFNGTLTYMISKSTSPSKRFMDRYFCFGAEDLAMVSLTKRSRDQAYKSSGNCTHPIS
ncbi:hypothetical protein AQUCO_02200276v1 [Aquilegia coerulea]|uniref:Uncharacterized protein n=1 Tax=Aquilegia coerulea TaxID=218851 RepID=A0A2G5DDZ5_AQUCA|nr:hypothetical protein AQUCO_02200276v1 [Aquilegia coerulea]